MRIFTRTAVVSFGFAVAIGAAAGAKPLSSDRDMVTGVSVTEADCRAQTGRLWVRVENRGFCVRFWLSTAGGSKDEALVAFHGDIGATIGGKVQLAEKVRPIDDGNLQKTADNGSRLYRGPYFFIARPGAFGSSGHHWWDRRKLLEIRIAMAALDALKRHNGFKRFHLVGQSGGGHTVAGLAQLRSDIGCAVITSGVVSLRSSERDRGHPTVGKQRFYDPIDYVHAMKQRPGLRLFVVSDRNDKIVSYRSQLEFVERVKAHNLPITHVAATATDKDSHGLFAHGHRLAVDCANNARDRVAVNKAWDQALIPPRSQPESTPAAVVPITSRPPVGDSPGLWPKPVRTLRITRLPSTSPAADPNQAERKAERAWTVTKDTTTISVLEEFVRRYGDSQYAARARARMEELRKSQAAAPTVLSWFDAVPWTPDAKPDADAFFVTRDLASMLPRAKTAGSVPREDVIAHVRDVAGWTGSNPAKTNAPDAWSERVVTVKKDDSAAAILHDLGASPEDVRALIAMLGAHGRDGGLRESQKLHILFAPDAGRLRVVRVVVVGDSAIEAAVALSETGTYVSVAPAAFSGVLAPPPKIPNRVDQPAQQDGAQQATGQPAVPFAAVAQRVVLYEEDPADPQGKRYVGSAVWRTETVTPSPGAAPDIAVRADLEIPERRITMTFSLRRNLDRALPASHTIEFTFNLPADFPFGGISNVPGILMKQAEQTRGAPLAGLAVKVTSGFFLVGLSAVEADMQRNLPLLKERSWFDVPIVYNNGRRAILALEKGTPGERAFEEAFKAWGQTSADPVPADAKTYAPAVQPVPLLVPPQPSVATTNESNRVHSPAALCVQVSAQKSEADARSSYRALQTKYPAVLGGHGAMILRVELSGGTWYRSQVGPFASSSRANEFCDSLKAAGGQCIMQRCGRDGPGSEPRERDPKTAEPRRASVEQPSSKPARAPRQAKPRGSGGRCFVLGGRSFCE